MQTLADIVVDELNDRDIMLFLGQLNSVLCDVNEFREIFTSKGITGTPRKLMLHKLNELCEDVEGMQEEVEDIYYKLDIKVNDLGYYPVLFRGKEKEYQWINICNIQCESLPLNKEGLQTAQLVRGNIPVPPVSLSKLDNGQYKLNDGRHRFLAFKLNGLEKIPAYVNPGKNTKE